MPIKYEYEGIQSVSGYLKGWHYAGLFLWDGDVFAHRLVFYIETIVSFVFKFFVKTPMMHILNF